MFTSDIHLKKDADVYIHKITLCTPHTVLEMEKKCSIRVGLCVALLRLKIRTGLDRLNDICLVITPPNPHTRHKNRSSLSYS